MNPSNPVPPSVAVTNPPPLTLAQNQANVNPPVSGPNQGLDLSVIFLRLGLAFVFIYAAISMSLLPETYAHYLPLFLRQRFPTDLLLHFFGGYEIIFSLWLLWGKWNLIPAILATVTIFSLTVVNLDSFNILFRNISIFFSSLALVIINLKNERKI